MKIFSVFSVEPEALKQWSDFRYIMEKFGFSKGNILAKVPKSWPKLVLDNIETEGPVGRLKFVEKLKQYKEDRMISLSCNFDGNLEWNQNIPRISDSDLVDKIIISNTSKNFYNEYPTPEEVDEEYFKSPTEIQVETDASSLANPAELLLMFDNKYVMVDPYFGVTKKSCTNVLRKFIETSLKHHNKVHFSIIAANKSAPKDPKKSIKAFCETFPDYLIEDRVSLCFRYSVDDSQLHARYFLTSSSGLRYDKGFREGDSKEKMDISILDDALHKTLIKKYINNDDPDVYEEYSC